jgi:hypothetical protein
MKGFLKVIVSALEDAPFQQVLRIQSKYLQQLKQLADENAMPLATMPFFDMEVRGVAGLRIFSKLLIQQATAAVVADTK